MNILYMAPDVSITGATGGSIHVLEISKNLVGFGNNVHLVSRRDSFCEGKHCKIENINAHKIFRGILIPLGYTPELMRDSATYTVKRFLTFLYLRTIFALYLLIYTLHLCKKYEIHVIIERASSFGAGVVAAKILGIPSILEVIDPLYSKFAAQRAGLVFAYTPKIFDRSIREKIRITSAGANLKRFDAGNGNEIRSKYGLLRKKVVIYVGGFEPWHGVQDLLWAMNFVDAVLLVVGGNDGIKFKTEKEVIFVGKVDPSEVPKYIKASDVAVAPFNPAKGEYTRIYGNYFSPIKIFEYMACSKPVVATDVDIVSDVIKDAECGLLAKPGDPESIADAIKKILEDENLAKKMGENGRRVVEKKYTWEKTSREIYQGILELVQK